MLWAEFILFLYIIFPRLIEIGNERGTMVWYPFYRMIGKDSRKEELFFMKEKFMRFMQGRYGADNLCRFLSGVCMVFLVISLFSRHQIWFLLALAALIYNYFRMFSRNIGKRYAENQKYLAMTAAIRKNFAKKKNEMAQRKTHHIYKCPGCGQKIRVPKGRGRIEIRCPKCSQTFVKNS